MNFWDWQWLHPGRVHLLWIVLAITGLLLWLEKRRSEGLGEFLQPVMKFRLVRSISKTRAIVRIVCMFCAMSFGVLALMRPQSASVTEEVESSQVSADIMVVLDLSKSMLASDAAPNRLNHAKTEINALLDEMPGHRVGLVGFAGRASILCPLTPDYSFFRLNLEQADPSSISRGGTRIGDAIRKAMVAFGSNSAAGAKLILLITDGEDQESNPKEAATRAADAGVRIISIGFGSEEGSQIMITDEKTGAKSALLDPATNQPVISRLDGELLRSMALTTSGAYVPAKTGGLDLKPIVKDHIEPMVRDSAAKAVRTNPKEQNSWFILGALVMLSLSALLGGGARAMHSLMLIGFVASFSQIGCEGRVIESRQGYNQAMALLKSDKLSEAESGFLSARDKAGHDPELRFESAFGLGVAIAKQAEKLAQGEKEDKEKALGRYGESGSWFEDAIRISDENWGKDQNKEARRNLEKVRLLAQQLFDELNRDQNRLEVRLDALLKAQREIRSNIQKLLTQIMFQKSGADPLAFGSEFDQLATVVRTQVAETGSLVDIVGDEQSILRAKPEDGRSPEDNSRLAALDLMTPHLEKARHDEGTARLSLRRLDGKAAESQTADAISSLKRAREQLLDPVTVLREVAQDEAELLQYTQILAAWKNKEISITGGDKSAEPPPDVPSFLTEIELAKNQTALAERLSDATTRLSLQGEKPSGGAQAAQSRPSKAVIEEAVVLLNTAQAAMKSASAALGAGQVKAASEAEEQAISAIAKALERFLDARQMIDLVAGQHGQVKQILEPFGKDDPLQGKERLNLLRTLTGQNQERIVRLKELLAVQKGNELAQLDASAGQGQDVPGAAAGGAPAPAPSAEEAAQKKAQIEGLYSQAEIARAKVESSHSELLKVLAGGTLDSEKARPKASQTQTDIDELRKLFFSIIDHLKELIREQGNTGDETSAMASQTDEERNAKLPGVKTEQAAHAELAAQLAAALDEQAKKLQENPPPPDPSGKPGPDPQKMTEAANEIRAGQAAMAQALTTLGEATDSQMSVDLTPAVDNQAVALQHLESALAILEPPQNQDQQKEQQDQKDQQNEPDKNDKKDQPKDQNDQKDQNARSQAQQQDIRDRDAERQRRKRNMAPPEPVAKDW